jgi:hypothetical protein
MRFTVVACVAGGGVLVATLFITWSPNTAHAQPPILPYPSPSIIPRPTPGAPSVPLALVRGRLTRSDRPAVGIPVNVFNQQLGYSGYSYSGPDGMYFLYNIPPGEYDLLVWAIPGRPVAYRIRVLAPNTDIAPIRVQ